MIIYWNDFIQSTALCFFQHASDSNRDLKVFQPLCTSFNNIAHSHRPIQQPSLWLSNHRLHLFSFSSRLSLSCFFSLHNYGLLSFTRSVCLSLSKTNPVVSKNCNRRKCLLTFRHRLVLGRGADCYLWLRADCDWLRRYNYVWRSV